MDSIETTFKNTMAASFILKLWGAMGYAALLLAGPYYAVRMGTSRKYRAGLRQRFTLYSTDEIESFQKGIAIWIHTVSVGELQTARPLLQRIKIDYPQYNLLVTTVTDTGQGLAKQLEEVDSACYIPLDLYPLCRRALEKIQPACVIIFETELWPNFIRAVSEKNIPLFLVNARLSDRSFRRYRRARTLFRPVLTQFKAILAQSEADAERFRALGTPEEYLSIPGNLKFEAAAPQNNAAIREQWRSIFGLGDGDLLLVGGSTFAGEEKILAQVMMALKHEGIPIRLLIAPRHVERATTVIKELESMNLQPVLRSQMQKCDSTTQKSSVFILDTVGELQQVYAAADLVFMGKSLCAQGGQNPLEPAAWGKPILFGPNMQNFREITTLLLQKQGARRVQNREELQSACLELCNDSQQREQMGCNALTVVQENQGVLERIMDTLSSTLKTRASNK